MKNFGCIEYPTILNTDFNRDFYYENEEKHFTFTNEPVHCVCL